MTPEERRHRDATWAELYALNHPEYKEPKMVKFLVAETDVEEASACKQNFDADNYWIVSAEDGFRAIELVKANLEKDDPEYYSVVDDSVEVTWQREDKGGGKFFLAMRFDGEMVLLYTAIEISNLPVISQLGGA